MSLPIIGITMGDPTGIGPEILVKALLREALFETCRPVVFGDEDVLLRTGERFGLPLRVEPVDAIPRDGYRAGKIFLVPVSRLEAATLTLGRPDRRCGEAMVNAIERAVSEVLAGRIDAITTCPVNKHAIDAAGHPFSGHTELLARLSGTADVAMMFVGSKWNIVLVTTHLPLKEVSRSITRKRVVAKIELANEGLKRYFGIPNPRIAVLGLNPHCGEEGLLGEEEQREIVPAIEEAKRRGFDVSGPFPGDSFFDLSKTDLFEVVIAMYHDQGLIPVKMLDFREAVNFTLGLPFIRTSVGHGTGYDIAGKGLGDPENLIKAIQIASNFSKLNRKK